MELTDKRALITGSTGGIGSETARLMGAAGAVTFLYRDEIAQAADPEPGQAEQGKADERDQSGCRGQAEPVVAEGHTDQVDQSRREEE